MTDNLTLRQYARLIWDDVAESDVSDTETKVCDGKEIKSNVERVPLKAKNNADCEQLAEPCVTSSMAQTPTTVDDVATGEVSSVHAMAPQDVVNNVEKEQPPPETQKKFQMVLQNRSLQRPHHQNPLAVHNKKPELHEKEDKDKVSRIDCGEANTDAGKLAMSRNATTWKNSAQKGKHNESSLMAKAESSESQNGKNNEKNEENSTERFECSVQHFQKGDSCQGTPNQCMNCADLEERVEKLESNQKILFSFLSSQIGLIHSSVHSTALAQEAFAGLHSKNPSELRITEMATSNLNYQQKIMHHYSEMADYLKSNGIISANQEEAQDHRALPAPPTTETHQSTRANRGDHGQYSEKHSSGLAIRDKNSSDATLGNRREEDKNRGVKSHGSSRDYNSSKRARCD